MYIYIVMPFLYGSVWFHDKKKKPSAEKMMRKTHGIWRWGIPLDKVKNCGTWKISTLKNIYRKTGNIYSISSQISFYHISTPYFFLQYIHWNIIEIIYSYSFIHISTVYLQYIYSISTYLHSLNITKRLTKTASGSTAPSGDNATPVTEALGASRWRNGGGLRRNVVMFVALQISIKP